MEKLIGTGLISLFVALAVQAGDSQPDCPLAKGGEPCVQACKLMREATLEVTSIDNGVMVKITSDDSDKAKQIQACWTARAAKKDAAQAEGQAAPAPCGSAGRSCGGCPGKKAKQ